MKFWQSAFSREDERRPTSLLVNNIFMPKNPGTDAQVQLTFAPTLTKNSINIHLLWWVNKGTSIFIGVE